jgi:hypothetical protein
MHFLLDFYFFLFDINVRIIVRAKEAIHKSQDLSVVKYELSVVNPMVTSSVYKSPSSESDAIVDGDTPAHNEEQGSQDEVLVQGNEERHGKVREALNERVHWMESGTSERIDGNKVVMRLVNKSVEERYFVQDSVSPVDQELADNNEQGSGDGNPSPAVLFNVVVDLAVLGEMACVDPWGR